MCLMFNGMLAFLYSISVAILALEQARDSFFSIICQRMRAAEWDVSDSDTEPHARTEETSLDRPGAGPPVASHRLELARPSGDLAHVAAPGVGCRTGLELHIAARVAAARRQPRDCDLSPFALPGLGTPLTLMVGEAAARGVSKKKQLF